MIILPNACKSVKKIGMISKYTGSFVHRDRETGEAWSYYVHRAVTMKVVVENTISYNFVACSESLRIFRSGKRVDDMNSLCLHRL